jgi:hypothetical protein
MSNVVIVLDRIPDLPEIHCAVGTVCVISPLADRRHQYGKADGNDCHHHEQFSDREVAAAGRSGIVAHVDQPLTCCPLESEKRNP